jgi:hypothetical protein
VKKAGSAISCVKGQCANKFPDPAHFNRLVAGILHDAAKETQRTSICQRKDGRCTIRFIPTTKPFMEEVSSRRVRKLILSNLPRQDLIKGLELLVLHPEILVDIILKKMAATSVFSTRSAMAGIVFVGMMVSTQVQGRGPWGSLAGYTQAVLEQSGLLPNPPSLETHFLSKDMMAEANGQSSFLAKLRSKFQR